MNLTQRKGNRLPTFLAEELCDAGRTLQQDTQVDHMRTLLPHGNCYQQHTHIMYTTG